MGFGCGLWSLASTFDVLESGHQSPKIKALIPTPNTLRPSPFLHPRQPLIEVLAADAKYARGFGLVAASRCQNLANVIDLDFGERRPPMFSISLRRGQSHTLCLTLPPLAALYLTPGV